MIRKAKTFFWDNQILGEKKPHLYMKRGKIRLLLGCLAAHAATRKKGFVFIFFDKGICKN
jgi:hypothetical protein